MVRTIDPCTYRNERFACVRTGCDRWRRARERERENVRVESTVSEHAPIATISDGSAFLGADDAFGICPPSNQSENAGSGERRAARGRKRMGIAAPGTRGHNGGGSCVIPCGGAGR